MSSKNDERRNTNNVIKKKKRKHKNRDIKEEEQEEEEEIISPKNNKHKHNALDVEVTAKIQKSHKHNKHVDSDDEIKIAKQTRKEKKQKSNKNDKVLEREKTDLQNPVKQTPILLSTDSVSDTDSGGTKHYKEKNNVKDENTAQSSKSSKTKPKIYSSSEDEAAEVHEVKTSPVPKKVESSADDYFDGWSKEDVVQLITRMSAALPKNDTLKYVSRVEKLNWDQVAFGQHTPGECKEKWKMIDKKIRGYRILQEVLADAKVWIEQPWTDFYRGGKKNRHPDLPKKPLTSYMIFYMKKKERITKENPGIGLTSLSKIIADKFNKLSPKKKAKYNKLANVMREKYQEDMQKFFHDHPGEEEKIMNAAKNKKGPITGIPGPAKPIPPLKLFLEDKIKQHKDEKDFNQALLIQQCKEKWKSMSSKKKMPWIRWAHEAEMKYLEELKSYQAENPSFEMPKFKSVLSKEEKKVLQRMEGKPEKPPGSAYGLFSKLMLKDPDLRAKYSTPKERMQEIAKMWKDVPKLEKDGYAEQVKHLLENYKLEYASYLESLPEDKREEELASNLPKRKAKMEDPSFKTAQKKLKVEKKTAKVEETEIVILEDLIAKEPKAPSGSTFDLFEEEMKRKGLSNKKIKKAWEEASESTKQKYETKLEALRQQYIIDYKAFLTGLKPQELQAYSEWKGKNQSQPVDVDSQASEASSEESEAEEAKVENKKDDAANSLSSGSSGSSSTANSSSSASSSSSSSEAEEQDDYDSDPF